MLKFESGFEVLRVSDLSYNGMTTEVVYNGEQIARLDMDNGASDVRIEIFTEFTVKEFVPKFRLDDLIAVRRP